MGYAEHNSAELTPKRQNKSGIQVHISPFRAKERTTFLLARSESNCDSEASRRKKSIKLFGIRFAWRY